MEIEEIITQKTETLTSLTQAIEEQGETEFLQIKLELFRLIFS